MVEQKDTPNVATIPSYILKTAWKSFAQTLKKKIENTSGDLPLKAIISVGELVLIHEFKQEEFAQTAWKLIMREKLQRLHYNGRVTLDDSLSRHYAFVKEEKDLPKLEVPTRFRPMELLKHVQNLVKKIETLENCTTKQSMVIGWNDLALMYEYPEEQFSFRTYRLLKEGKFAKPYGEVKVKANKSRTKKTPEKEKKKKEEKIKAEPGYEYHDDESRDPYDASYDNGYDAYGYGYDYDYDYAYDYGYDYPVDPYYNRNGRQEDYYSANSYNYNGNSEYRNEYDDRISDGGYDFPRQHGGYESFRERYDFPRATGRKNNNHGQDFVEYDTEDGGYDLKRERYDDARVTSEKNKQRWQESGEYDTIDGSYDWRGKRYDYTHNTGQNNQHRQDEDEYLAENKKRKRNELDQRFSDDQKRRVKISIPKGSKAALSEHLDAKNPKAQKKLRLPERPKEYHRPNPRSYDLPTCEEPSRNHETPKGEPSKFQENTEDKSHENEAEKISIKQENVDPKMAHVEDDDEVVTIKRERSPGIDYPRISHVPKYDSSEDEVDDSVFNSALRRSLGE